jgi:phosphatidylserine synthase
MTVPLAKEMYKLSTYVTRTIRRNIKFLPQTYQSKFEVGEKKYFCRGPIPAAAFCEIMVTFSCAATPPTARQKILNTLVCVTDNSMLESLPLHRTTMILWGELTHLMLYCIRILTKEE